MDRPSSPAVDAEPVHVAVVGAADGVAPTPATSATDPDGDTVSVSLAFGDDAIASTGNTAHA